MSLEAFDLPYIILIGNNTHANNLLNIICYVVFEINGWKNKSKVKRRKEVKV